MMHGQTGIKFTETFSA